MSVTDGSLTTDGAQQTAVGGNGCQCLLLHGPQLQRLGTGSQVAAEGYGEG